MDIILQIYDEKKFLRKGIISKKLLFELRDFAQNRSAFCIIPDNFIVLLRPRYIHNDTIEREIEEDINHEVVHLVLWNNIGDEACSKWDSFRVEAFIQGYSKAKSQIKT